MNTRRIVYNMPAEEYFAVDAASNSTLGRMIKSPAHCRAYLDAEREETPALRLGSLVHCLVLEPKQYSKLYVIAPEINRRTKAGKEEWDRFHDEHGYKTIITPDELHEATAMAESVLAHPAAGKLIDGGNAEVSLFWEDPETGFPCKARADYITKSGYMVDLKTTADASCEEFARSMAKFGYHRQQAFYTDGYEQVLEKRPKGFVFIAVEKKPPYAVGVYMLDADSEQLGRNEYRPLLESFAECSRADQWPAYETKVQQISLPAWAFKKGYQS